MKSDPDAADARRRAELLRLEHELTTPDQFVAWDPRREDRLPDSFWDGSELLLAYLRLMTDDRELSVARRVKPPHGWRITSPILGITCSAPSCKSAWRMVVAGAKELERRLIAVQDRRDLSDREYDRLLACFHTRITHPTWKCPPDRGRFLGLRVRASEPRWHFLERESCSEPLRGSWTSTEYVRSLKRSRWELLFVMDDFDARIPRRTIREHHSASGLVLRLAELDEHDTRKPEARGAETGRSRLDRLASIARSVGAPLVVRRVKSCQEGTWPKPKLPKITAIVGVAKRQVWLHHWHATFAVITTKGPAYLYPPDDDGCATLAFGGELPGHTVRLKRSQIRELKTHEPARALLEAELRSH